VNIINVIQIGVGESATMYVVTLGQLGNDVAVYRNNDSTGLNVGLVAQQGTKLSAREFEALEPVLLTGLIQDLPRNWYYRV
jgi:hypothetical protein